MEKPTEAELVKKIEEARGNISAVARAYNRPRSTIYSWIASYEMAKQAWKDQRELVVDAVEDRLFKRAIVDENDQSMFYILNNMKEAKERGWSPRSEVVSDATLNIKVSYGEKEDE